MSCQILVSNKSGAPKAEIISIVSGEHMFSAKESMQRFIANDGTFETWGRKFSIVKITDKDLSDLIYLNDRYDDLASKWVFIEPETNTTEWQDLYLTGEVEREWSVVSQYLVERR